MDEEKKTVTHIPSVALVPNLILKRQMRSVTLSGDRLILCAIGIPAGNGSSVTSRLEWQRTAWVVDMTIEEVSRVHRDHFYGALRRNDLEKLQLNRAVERKDSNLRFGWNFDWRQHDHDGAGWQREHDRVPPRRCVLQTKRPHRARSFSR